MTDLEHDDDAVHALSELIATPGVAFALNRQALSAFLQYAHIVLDQAKFALLTALVNVRPTADFLATWRQEKDSSWHLIKTDLLWIEESLDRWASLDTEVSNRFVDDPRSVTYWIASTSDLRDLVAGYTALASECAATEQRTDSSDFDALLGVRLLTADQLSPCFRTPLESGVLDDGSDHEPFGKWQFTISELTGISHDVEHDREQASVMVVAVPSDDKGLILRAKVIGQVRNRIRLSFACGTSKTPFREVAGGTVTRFFLSERFTLPVYCELKIESHSRSLPAR